jgi:hypothetical protein
MEGQSFPSDDDMGYLRELGNGNMIGSCFL